MNITNLFKKTGLDMPDYIKHQFKRFLFSYTRTSVAAFVLFVALCGQIFATEAITNGSFSSGSSGWTLSGDFWAGTNLSNYHTSPGYAAGGVDGAGTAKNSANGSMSQQVTIPSGATSVTLTYWYSITTQEIGGSAYDILNVVVNNANIVDTLSNVNNTSGSYQQRSAINLSSYAGQTITLKFAATTDVSNTTVFRIDDVSLTYTPLSVPTAPSNFQASVNDLHVTFSWTNNSPSDQYDVHAITDSSYIGIFSPNITTATTDLYSYGTSHCYTVMAHNAAGWSSESNQVCITPMSQPSLSSPSYGYQYPSGTPSANLSWNSVPGAVSYAINVSLYNTTGSYGVLASPYISNQGASGTSATISVSNGQTYYWQVIAYNDSPGASHWSSVYSFSVASPIPVTPTLSSPANGYSYPTGTTATTVYWNSSLNSTSYDVQVGGSCGDNSVYFGNTTNLNQAISGLSSGQTYNWQVRGNNNGTVSNFSGCYSFTIAPPIPGFASPANGYSYPSGTTSATLSWNSATGATSYDLQVGGSCGSSSLYSGNTSNLNRTVSGLTDGQTYYWRMQANNSAGASGYSSCRSFSVNTPPTITTITPNSGLNNASLNITNLAGTNFVSGATVKLTKSGQSDITATNVVFVNSTQLTCTLPISGAASGAWNVVVINPDTQSATLSNGFTVTTLTAPTITTITPNSGLNNASLNITNLAGTNFVSGATVKLTKSGQSDITATNVVFVNSTQLTCTLPISGAASGAWNVVVTNPDAQSATLSNGFTVTVPAYVLTVASINPASGVSVTVSPADNNSASNGSTQFTRTYNSGTSVTLTAPAIPGSNFQKWQRGGVDYSTNQSITFTMDAAYTMTAVYTYVPTYVLTVASVNPASGVSVTVSPADNNAASNGNTQFTRTYNSGTSVTLTAPATAGGNNFQKWQRDGVDYSTTQSITFTMDAAHTMTAVYVPAYVLTVASVNPASGALIIVSPNDNNAASDGNTQFTRTYNSGTLVTLNAAMAELQGYSYKWQRDGVDYSADGSASITMNANHTMTFFNMPPPPTITSITPISGLNNATVSITNLTGTKFVSGATVKLTKAGQNDIAATAVGFMSSTQLTCTLPITGAVPGQWNVVVTNPDGQSGTLTNGFMVNAPYPTVTSIDPGLGTNNASLSITNLAGTGFYIGASVKLTQTGQADITAANIVVVNDTKITCDLPLNGAAIGQWNVIVANADTRSGALNNGFFVKAVPPTITSIAPAQGPNTGVVSITNLAGTSFLTGAAVKLTKTGQSDIPGTSVNVNAITSATITCTFDLTGAATGQWNVTVTNPDNNFVTLNNGFTVSLPAPVLSSVNPTSGLNTGSVTGAQLGGSYFISGAIVKLTKTGQSDIAVTGVVFVGPAQLTCTFPITGAVPGLWNVVVTNSDGQTNTLSNSFMVNAPYPTVASIDPSSGTNTGSLNISNLAGTNFYTGASVKLTKSGQTDIIATNVTVVSDTKITCTLLLNGAAIGLWNVVVTNADTRSGTLSNGFTVKAVPPTMTSIAPAQGVSTGTVSITNLAGTGFLSGAVVKLSKTGQTDITATSVNVVTAAKITCIFDLTNAATGTWNVTVTNLDNNSATLAGSFTVRLPAPAVSSVNPASGLNYTPLSGVIVNGSYFLSGATVKLAKAGQSDIAATDVVFVNSTQLTCTLPLTISMVPGQWNVVVTNTDAQSGTLGNGFNATVDATPPAGVPSTPSAGVVYTSSTIITFNWDQGTATDPESGIAGYYLQVGHNSALPANIFDGYVGNVFSKTFTGEGAYYARVRAKNPYDLYGNYSPWSAGAFIDTTPPSAPVVESPTNPSSAVTYISAAVTFNLSAQDTSGIAGYYYKIDQLTGTMPDNVSCAYFTGAATSTVLSAGAWYAHFVAVDMAGNIGVNEGHFNIHIGSAINPSQDNVFQAGDGATVAIPAGTLSAAADILISVPSSVPPAPRDATSKDTGISEEIKLSNAALTLQKNITISLPYTYSQVSTADEDSLKLSYYNTAKVRWEIIYDSVVDKIKKTVTAVVNHLSLFKIVAYTPQNGELASVGNYPNPFTAGRGGTTKIHYSLKADSSVDIRIYDLLGKPVWHKTLPSGAVGGSIGVNDVAWDGKNDKGAYVGAGAYICIVKAGSEKKTIKVAVK